MYNVSLNENALTFKEIEKKIYKMVCDEACSVLKSVLEALDEKLLKERDIKVYRNKGFKKTCLRTIIRKNWIVNTFLHNFYSVICDSRYSTGVI